VAILLNKKAENAWNAAGRPEPYKSGAVAGDNTRILMIELLFQPKKKQSTRIFVTSVYVPQSGITAKNPEFLPQFYQKLEDLTQHANLGKESPTEKRYMIMGGDWNASIGVREDESPETTKLLGKHGIRHVNEPEKNCLT
jgi:exonuclease III